MNDFEANPSLRLGGDALAQHRDMAVLWLAGDNFTGFGKSPECGGGAEGKLTIVRADIDDTTDAAQRLLQPVVQFVLTKAEDLAERIARVHHNARTAE